MNDIKLRAYVLYVNVSRVEKQDITEMIILAKLSEYDTYIFFFQAEDGIRDLTVTGVQTCALPILLHAVQDNTEVHRVVLPYRAWEILDLVGKDHAHTLLRQSVHYCVQAEQHARSATWDRPREVLPAMFDQFKLMDITPGQKQADDAFVEKLSQTLFSSSPDDAARAAASALADGFSPDVVGQAISLAANQLVLRDHGRRPSEESPGKPIGSVHGDSIGVHACDSANAWR